MDEYGCLAVPPLKVECGWVITRQSVLGMQLLAHTLISFLVYLVNDAYSVHKG